MTHTKIPDPANSPAMQRVVALLKIRGSLSVAEIARDAYISETSLTGGGYLKRLQQARLVYISGWRKNSNGFTTPQYSAGDEDDFPRPGFEARDRDSLGMARIVAALKRLGPLTYKEVALAAGLSVNTVKNAQYMDSLCAQQRIHVCAWRRNKNGPMAPVYEAGAGIDAIKPAHYSAADKSRRYRQKQRLLNIRPTLLNLLAANDA